MAPGSPYNPLVSRYRVRDERIRRSIAPPGRSLRIWQGLHYYLLSWPQCIRASVWREVESGFRYTPSTCFETFPFPQPTAEQTDAIAQAAAELNPLREAWLNPAPVAGLPLAEKELKKRTLTNLYNQRPSWLVNTHTALDAAVLAAYGWEPQIGDDEILARLLKLNHEREPA